LENRWGVLGNRRVVNQGSREWMCGEMTVSHKGEYSGHVESLEGLVLLGI